MGALESISKHDGRIPVAEIRDRIAGVIRGEVPIQLVGDLTFEQRAWTLQEITVLIGGTWEVKFFIDAGDLDYIESIDEFHEGIGYTRWYDISGKDPNHSEPLDALEDLGDPALGVDPTWKLEKIIAALKPLPKVTSGDQEGGSQEQENQGGVG